MSTFALDLPGTPALPAFRLPPCWHWVAAGLVHLAVLAMVLPPAAQPQPTPLQATLLRPPPDHPAPVAPAPLPVPMVASTPAPVPPLASKPPMAAAPSQTVLTNGATTASPSSAPADSAPAPLTASMPVHAPVSITPARFDADYLHNPKPAYPLISRRMNEEGKVWLSVRVSPQGQALEVLVKQGSGFPRLDAAARDSVSQWRFSPARRGDEPLESWVTVPILFSLDQ